MRLEERKGAVRGARNHGGSVYTPCVYSLARVEEGCALLRVGVFPPGSVQRRAERRTERKRAEAISSVRCRAFHSLSFHDERKEERREKKERSDCENRYRRIRTREDRLARTTPRIQSSASTRERERERERESSPVCFARIFRWFA